MSSHQPASLVAAALKPARQPVELNWQRLNTLGVVLLIIGIIGAAVALSVGASNHLWQAWLVNLVFFMGIAQAGVVCSCAFYLTQARWAGSSHFRLAESFSRFIPLSFVLFWGIYFGRFAIFPWVTHPIAKKAMWLNVPFLFARDGIALLILTLLSMWFVAQSRGPEAAQWASSPEDIEMPPRGIRRLAPIIAILYCVTYSLIAFDLIMSLSPLWHSTLFGWWWFATCFWSAAVAMALTTVLMRRQLGAATTLTRPGVLHDLGKMVFAFSIFWIYLSFAQYLVIWYGDLPTETFFLVVRLWHHPLTMFGWLAPLLIWAVPFTVLMSVRTKRSPAVLGTVAALGLIGVWDLDYILIVPSLSPDKIPFGWFELCVTAGFLGAFLLCAVPGLKLLAESARAIAEERE